MATSTQGEQLTVGVQTDFNTPATPTLDVRLEGSPDVETAVGTGVDPDFVGANPYQEEKPIVENMASDSAVKCSSLIRQATTAGQDSFLVTAFESGGYNVSSTTDTTIDGVGAVGEIPAVDTALLESGMGVNVETALGFFPTLIGDLASDNIIPTMELPSIPTTGGDIRRAFTITPANLAQVANDKLLTMVYSNKAGTVTSQDCALTAIGDLNFTANEKFVLEYTFGASNKTRGDTPMTGNNAFQDATASKIVHCPTCQFTDTSTDYSTALTAAYHKLISATVTFNVTAEQIIGFGDPNCKNNIQAWMQKAEPATISLDMLYDSTKLSDFDGTNDSKYLSVIQAGSSATDPAVGFFMPNAHQMEAPEVQENGNNEHRVTVKYVSNPSGMDGTTSSDLGNEPWYLVVGDRSAT